MKPRKSICRKADSFAAGHREKTVCHETEGGLAATEKTKLPENRLLRVVVKKWPVKKWPVPKGLQ